MYSRLRGEQVQRPWGESMLGISEEEQGGLSGWSAVNTGREVAGKERGPGRHCSQGLEELWLLLR